MAQEKRHDRNLIPNPLSLKPNKRVGVVPLCRPSDHQIQGQPRGDCPYQNESRLVGFGISGFSVQYHAIRLKPGFHQFTGELFNLS